LSVASSTSSIEHTPQKLTAYPNPSLILKSRFSEQSHQSSKRPPSVLSVIAILKQQIPSFQVISSDKTLSSGPTSNRQYQVVIKDQKFRPESLKIELGSTVEWHLQCDSVKDEYSLYYERSRSHVIAFDSLSFESPLLRISNRGTPDVTKTTFRITFLEPGTF
jgi:hypothetical protein